VAKADGVIDPRPLSGTANGLPWAIKNFFMYRPRRNWVTNRALLGVISSVHRRRLSDQGRAGVPPATEELRLLLYPRGPESCANVEKVLNMPEPVFRR